MRKNIIVRNIPNTITCLNIIGGTAAIICASKGNVQMWGLSAWQWAWIFIGISALADFCDGLSARLLGAYSDMGKELDSICDVVSFGVAPAILLYNAILAAHAPEWLAWTSLLIPIGGALRLARFNTDPNQATTFTGLPIPANAVFWIGFTSLYYELHGINNWITLICIIGMSWLMVSSLRMFSLKFHGLGWKGNTQRWMLVLATLLFIIAGGITGLMWTILYYSASSAFMKFTGISTD